MKRQELITGLSPKLILLLLTVVSLRFNALAQPFPIIIEVTTDLSPRGPIAELSNSILATINNQTSATIQVYFEVSLRGITPDIDNIDLNNRSTANAFDFDVRSGPPQSYTLRSLEALYEGLDVSDFDLSTVLPWQRALIEEQRILPAGTWEICIQAFRFLDGLPVSDRTVGAGCARFQVTPRTPPRIVSPVDLDAGTWVAEIANDALFVNWIIDEPGGNTYLLEVKEFLDVEDVRRFNESGRAQDEFDALITLDAIPDISALQYNLVDRGIDLVPEHWYALRVTASSAQSPFADQGRSNIVVFAYGVDVSAACQRPSVTANVVFPMLGDTLPYIDPYVLVEFSPACPSTIEADATLRIESPDAGIAGGTWDYDPNLWRSGPGPAAFLRSYFRRQAPDNHDTYWYPEGSGYERFLPLIDFDGRHDFVRGAHYTANVDIEFTHLDMALGRAEYTQPINVPGIGPGTPGFVVGMPRPRLDYPAHDQTIRTGDALEFRFNTGQAPTKPLPPFKSMRIDGGTREAAMPWLKVVEKCVFQLSKETEFTQENLLQSKLYRIQVNTADIDNEFAVDEPTVGTFTTSIDDTPERRFDESRILAQLYRPLEQNYTVVEEDTLYWRVVWLRNVDEINSLDLLAENITLSEADIYHASPVRRLIIDDDGPGTPVATTPSDNDPTDCTTGCEPTAPADQTALTTVTGLTTFKMGYFAVNDLELTSSTGGTLRGTGSVVVDFMFGAKFRVEFSNVRVNAAGEAIAGEVTGVKATTPFELDDINASLATAAGTLGQESRVNEWLQEVPGTRLLAELVGGDPVRLPVGLDRQIDGKSILLGITELRFTTEGATVKLLYEQQLDFLADDTYLSLGGEVCLKPSGFGAEVLLHLNRDLVFDANPNDTVVNSLRLKGSSGTPEEIRTTATHIEFNCACVKSFGLRFEGDLSRKRFVKEDASGQVVEGEAVGFRFGVRLNREAACDPEVLEEIPEDVRGRFRENNFLLTLDFDPFQLKQFEGWGFRVDDATVDLSSTENPAGMVFPDAYTDADFGIAEGTSSELSGQLRKTWTGFYLRELSIHAPTDLHEDEANPVFKAGVRHMIIDGEGLSVSIFLENLLDEETGSAGGWSFAIDTLEVVLAKNTFRSGRLAGDIGAPLLPTTEAIPYDALLTYSPPAAGAEGTEATTQHWGFLMSLRPTGELRLPPILGRATLNDNSYVAFKYGVVPAGAGTVPDSILQANEEIGLYLSGNIDISSENGGGSSAVSSLASTLNFTGMDFRLGYSNERGFHTHHFGMASPQKMMGAMPPGSDGGEGLSGFPVTIKDYGIDNNSRIEDRVLGATFWFEPELNFMGDEDGGFKASTRINLDLAYDLEDRRFKLEGASIGCISIGVAAADGGEGKTETHGITLEGSLCFYKDATRCTVTGASGVKGDLKVGLPVGEITLAAEFGSTSAFRYWFVDGKVVLSSGIPLGAIELIGIGGGFYYNMKIPGAAGREDARGYNAALVSQAAEMQAAPGTAMPSKSSATADGSAAASRVPASGFAPCPRDGSIVFKLVLPVATVSKHEVFNMDVSVKVTVERGVGVRQFTIMGDGYVMADIDERATAPVKTDIHINFEKRDDETKVFDASFAAYADISFGDVLTVQGVTEARALNGQMLKRVVEVAFHIETPPNDGQTLWYFRMGTPSAPAGLKVMLGGMDLAEVKTYLQVGNDIERGFMPYPPLIERLLGFPEKGEGGNRLAGGGNEYTGAQSGDPATIRYQSGAAPTAGFAMGLSFAVDLDVDAFLIYAKLGFAAGFDISLLDESGSKCYTASGNLISPYGYNGYYARGQIYAGIEGELGLQIKLIRTRRFALFRLGAAFQIQGGFPNPMWASGRAAISYSILGGLIDGSANVQFKVGEKCINPKTDPFGFPLIEEIIPTDGDNEVSALVKPTVYFVLPMNEVIALPVIDEDDGTVLHTDYLRPFVHQIGLRGGATANRRLDIATRIAYSVDRKTLTIKPSELLGDMNVELKLQLRADELRNDSWTAAQWPAASGKRGVWTSDTTVVFTTGGLPDQIPGELYVRSIPIKNQKYFLQSASYANGNDEQDSKYITFDRDLRRSYFKPSDAAPAGGGAPRSYKYVVELFPYDGGASIECPARLRHRTSSTVISYELPSALANDEIYRAAVVRVLERPAQTPLEQARARLGNQGGPLSPGATSGVNPVTRAFIDLDYGQDDLYNKVKLLTERREHQPAPESSPDHFPIFEYHFQTSRFNTLPEKVAGAETSLDILGEFYRYVLVRGEEGFDEADVLPMTVEGNTYEPLIIAHPTYGDRYWTTKVKPAYDNYTSLKYALENHRDRWRKEGRGVDRQLRAGEFTESLDLPEGCARAQFEFRRLSGSG